jgi:hypothetical protein
MVPPSWFEISAEFDEGVLSVSHLIFPRAQRRNEQPPLRRIAFSQARRTVSDPPPFRYTWGVPTVAIRFITRNRAVHENCSMPFGLQFGMTGGFPHVYQ